MIRFGLRLALGNDAVHERIEKIVFTVRAAVARRWPARRNIDGLARATQRVAHQKTHRAAYLLRFSRKRCAEERSHSRFQGKLRHFLRDIARFAIAPAADLRLRAFEHRRGILTDALTVKRRLRQAPLPPPEITFA